MTEVQGDKLQQERTSSVEKELSDEASSAAAVPIALAHSDDDFPDGGFRAWLVVFGVGHDLYLRVILTQVQGLLQLHCEVRAKTLSHEWR